MPHYDDHPLAWESEANDLDRDRRAQIRARYAAMRSSLERLIYDGNANHDVRQRASLRLGDLHRQERVALNSRVRPGYGA